MKPLLLIDFYRTLCHDKFWRSLGNELRDKIEHYIFGVNGVMANEWMQGRFTSEEINRKVAAEFTLDFEELWSKFVSDCTRMHIEQSNLDALQDLRKKYSVVLVSDNMDSFIRFTIPALGLGNYFDEIVDSYSQKELKGRELFKRLITTYKTDIAQAVLIDDSRKLCAVFTEMGGMAFCATNERPLGFWLEKLRGD